MSQNPMDIMIGASESQGRPDEALRRLELGRKAADAGDRPTMILEYRKAVAADPTNTHALFTLAFALDLLGDEQEAISLYERCCESTPAPINALMNLSVLYEDNGEYASAEKCLRQILETNPSHPRARLFMKDVMASRSMFVDEEQTRDVAKRNALMDTPVTDFELTVRARNCLKKMNIRSLGDLLRITEAELMAYKNFGEASLIEIKNMLTIKGLRLGQGLEEQHRRVRREVYESLKGGGNEAVLAKPVTDLGLSVRARKALQVLGIHTMGDLASRTEAELMGVKNFGATSLDEVKVRLAENGLKLRSLEF